MFDKKLIVEKVVFQLAEELMKVTQAAQSAYEAATHEESRSEDRHDTRGLEASYLAGAQAGRVAELERLIRLYKFLLLPHYESTDLIGPGALVELELAGRKSLYFLVPQGGGLSILIDGRPIRMITPLAPLGDALLGKKLGDWVEVEGETVTREYQVTALC